MATPPKPTTFEGVVYPGMVTVRPAMRDDLRLTMTFENLHTGTRVVRCLDFNSHVERINLKIEKPFPEVMTSGDLAEAMKARKRRQDLISRFASMFADYLDDRDGWNGPRRETAIEDMERNAR